MVYVGQMSEINNFSKSGNKIPEYARDYKKEYLFIRGINKSCDMLIKKILNSAYSDEKIFSSPGVKALVSQFKKVLEYERMGKLQNISELKFKYHVANDIECLVEELDNYVDLYVDPGSYEFDEETYEKNIDKDFPGFRELFDVVCLFNDKIKKDEEEHIGNIFQSDVSESESDDNEFVLPGDFFESDESESEDSESESEESESD